MIFRFLSVIVFAIEFIQINCHGRLLVPPARSSAWREDPVRFPVNYNDNAMFCGGFNALWQINNGKCSICGEKYGESKLYEKGGPLYRGYIVRTYNQGDTLNAVIEITANHYGYFEFRLCNVDNLVSDATQECLNENILTDLNGRSKIPVPRDVTGKITTTLRLPSGLSCNHCVLQWKYNGGNSWDTDPVTGQSCIGCGPQEQFYGCSDIAIIKASKREFKALPKYYSSSNLPYTQGDIDHSPLFQADNSNFQPYNRGFQEKTEIPSSLLKRLVDKLNSLHEHESQQEQTNNYETDNLIERDVINDNGDPAAQEQHKHNDKTLN